MPEITLNGHTYTDADFKGYGYTSRFPEQIFADLLAELVLRGVVTSVLTINGQGPDGTGNVDIAVSGAPALTPSESMALGIPKQLAGYTVDGVPIPALQAQIDAALAEGWLPAFIGYWDLGPEPAAGSSGSFALPSVTLAPVVSPLSMTGTSEGSFSIPGISLQPVVAPPSLVASEGGIFDLPAISLQPIVLPAELSGISQGQFDIPAASCQPIVVAPLLDASQSGSFTLPQVTLQPVVVAPTLDAFVSVLWEDTFTDADGSAASSTNWGSVGAENEGSIEESSFGWQIQSNALQCGITSLDGSLVRYILPSVQAIPTAYPRNFTFTLKDIGAGVFLPGTDYLVFYVSDNTTGARNAAGRPTKNVVYVAFTLVFADDEDSAIMYVGSINNSGVDGGAIATTGPGWVSGTNYAGFPASIDQEITLTLTDATHYSLAVNGAAVATNKVHTATFGASNGLHVSIGALTLQTAGTFAPAVDRFAVA